MEAIILYLAKASGILILFLGVYLIFLKRETFFEANRHFLLGGILLSFLLPFVEIKRYVIAEAVMYIPVETMTPANTLPALSQGLDWISVLAVVYLAGVIFLGLRFALQLHSLYRLLKSHRPRKIDGVCYVETDQDLAPFSFFNYVIYNPDQFSPGELDAIRQHEKAHCSQAHSLDILLAHMLTIVLWINPFSWLYKKHMQQNLEFLADSSAIRQTRSIRNYQYALLKVSSNAIYAPITNHFYSSLIKKRIVMLHKRKSNRLNVLKYALVLPLLAAFLFTFNTKVVAQEKEKDVKVELKISRIEVVIDKDYTEEQMKADTKFMKERGIDLKFKDIKRNRAGEITAISASYRDQKGISGNYSQNSDTPIQPFSFRVEGEGDDYQMGFFSGMPSRKSHAKNKNFTKRIVVETLDDEDQDGEEKMHKRMRILSEDHEGGFNWTGSDAGEKMEVLVEMKDGKKVIKVNGEEVSEAELKELKEGEDGERIMIRKIQKGEGGNVFILKDSDDDEDMEIIERGGNSFFFMDSEKGQDPLFIVDGKEMSKTEFEKMSPSEIEKVEVLKGDAAVKEYGDRAKDGVIKITTKKQ
ncbi:Signal transducer regulating beta-lactamase production, contains metallopeptidase domain [Muriicola jejuensis]|uniref:TonB-dependent receptor plug domain-containing protein n=1 Tax=Muriicola jejuensis TaxID=504488 RepID=A0A6P0UCA2_9FLAO|nr:M56 family metallopeptidase [Muriicola jejuensis]NER10667.1 TonB-dependent receptor plug domain-containing protein [Muriicola jejuensis]SMP17086.1 Signal transducer regulating beta-lactamase production, contains metallopeptidase domain [Muriicola jejuensis]